MCIPSIWFGNLTGGSWCIVNLIHFSKETVTISQGKYYNCNWTWAKNEEIIGNASIEFNIENIDTVKEIELPKVKMRAN